MEIPPFLFIFSFFLIIAVSSNEFPSPSSSSSSDEAAFERISDSQVEEDMKAVERAIQSPWVEQYPSGIKRMETKRESFSLTDAQKALFNRHWELETIQREKPDAPKQFDLEMFADALKLMLEMDPQKKTVLIWTHKLREWMEAKRGEGGNAEEEEEEMVETKGRGEKEEEGTKLANLNGQEGGEEMQMEEQCSEADRPAFLAKMGDPSNQTAVQMPIQAKEPTPPMASSIQAAMQQGNYLNGVDGFGRPMVLIMETNNISNGWEGKLEGQAQNGQQNIQTNIAENWEGQKEQKPIVNGGNGGIMYVVDEGNGGEGENAKIGGKSGEEFGAKNGEKGEENKGEEDKKEKEILASSEEGANEKTVFEAIRGQKKEGEGSKEKEDEKGRILVIDWANGGGKEEENWEDNVEEISRKLGAMKMVKMEEESNSSAEEQMTSPNGDMVEVEVIKPIKEEKDQKRRTNPGLLGILSEMLFSRKKREVIMMGEKANALWPTMPIPAAILGNKKDEQMPAPFTMPVAPEGVFANETILVNEGEKGEEGNGTEKNNGGEGRTIKLIRSFKGRLAMGKARLGISAKWEMMVNEQNEAKNEKKEKNNEEEVQKKGMTNQKDEPSGIKEEEGENMEKTKTSRSSAEKNEERNAERVTIKMADEKADLVKYLEWYLVKTNGPKREEKLAYVLYSELQYWLAKQIEKKFDGNGKDVHQILDETPSNKEGNQMDYLRSKWSNTMARLEILTKWIGKDFRRK